MLSLTRTLILASPMAPSDHLNSGGYDPVPPVQQASVSPEVLDGWTVKALERLNQLGAQPAQAGPSRPPLGQYRDASGLIREQLRQRYVTRHLLYLGSSTSGHTYAFPLESAGGTPNLRIALLQVSKRPPAEQVDRQRTIHFLSFIDVDVENKNLFFQNLLGADGGTDRKGPKAHDLYSLLADRIHSF